MKERFAKPKPGPRESFRTRVSARPSEGVEELVSSCARLDGGGRAACTLALFLLFGWEGAGEGVGVQRARLGRAGRRGINCKPIHSSCKERAMPLLLFICLL